MGQREEPQRKYTLRHSRNIWKYNIKIILLKYSLKNVSVVSISESSLTACFVLAVVFNKGSNIRDLGKRTTKFVLCNVIRGFLRIYYN